MCDEEMWKSNNIVGGGEYTIKMKDVTAKLNSSDDLARELGMKM